MQQLLWLTLITAVLAGCGEMSKPEMPVSISYRESYLNLGYVMQFTNMSEKHLRLLVKVENPTTGQAYSRYVDLSPEGSANVGWLQGWKFTSGDMVVAYHAGYKRMVFRIP